MSKNPHLNPRNGRRKGALERLVKELPKAIQLATRVQGDTKEHYVKNVTRIEQEIKTLESRIVK